MPATQVEKDRLRNMLNGDETSMPDAYLDDDVFAEAEAEYAESKYGRSVIFTAAALRAVQDMLFRAAAEVDYDEGDASEKRSQVFKQLEKMEMRFQKQLEQRIEDALPHASWWGFGPTPEYRDRPE